MLTLPSIDRIHNTSTYFVSNECSINALEMTVGLFWYMYINVAVFVGKHITQTQPIKVLKTSIFTSVLASIIHMAATLYILYGRTFTWSVNNRCKFVNCYKKQYLSDKFH